MKRSDQRLAQGTVGTPRLEEDGRVVHASLIVCRLIFCDLQEPNRGIRRDIWRISPAWDGLLPLGYNLPVKRTDWCFQAVARTYAEHIC